MAKTSIIGNQQILREREIFIDKNGSLVLEMGAELSGLHWKGEALPTANYEITLQAKRTMGSDFFAGLLFHIKRHMLL